MCSIIFFVIWCMMLCLNGLETRPVVASIVRGLYRYDFTMYSVFLGPSLFIIYTKDLKQLSNFNIILK